MVKHTIQITILDDSRSEKCEANCGIDWSSPESIALASQRIEERFGNKAHLEYLDLSKSSPDPKYSQVVRSKSLSFPLLLINGELRISGQFDMRQLLDAIETEMEVGA